MTKRVMTIALAVIVLAGCSPESEPTLESTPTPTAATEASASPSEEPKTSTPTETPEPTHSPATEAPVKPERAPRPKGDDRWSQIRPKALADECKKDGWSFERCLAFDKELERRLNQAAKQGVRESLKEKSSAPSASVDDSWQRQAEAGEPLEVGDANGDDIPDDIRIEEGQQ